jgi:F420H(2)-dependent quinone reductase
MSNASASAPRRDGLDRSRGQHPRPRRVLIGRRSGGAPGDVRSHGQGDEPLNDDRGARGPDGQKRRDRLSLRGRLAISSSQLANRRGIYLGRRSARIHVALYQRTDGRIGGHLPGLPAARIVLVDHAGAKTGVRRTSPLIYHEADGVVAVVASKAGQPTHPAWFHNLVAHPETTLQLGSEVRAVRARVAGDEERSTYGRSSRRSIPDTTSSSALPRAGRSRS